jgi:hypothetical protein
MGNEIMNDERLSGIYQQILARTSQASPGTGVTPEEMLAVIERRVPDAERLRILDRVMQSEETRQDFELLRTAMAASRPARLAVPRWAVAAAAVVLLTTGGLVVWRVATPDSVLRGSGSNIELTAPHDSPAVSAPLVFAWRRVPRAVSYEIELVEGSGTLVHIGTVQDTTWTPPESVHLASGVEYRWWVRATLDDGTTIEAPPRRLVLSP